jgi:hypothetical protein
MNANTRIPGCRPTIHFAFLRVLTSNIPETADIRKTTIVRPVEITGTSFPEKWQAREPLDGTMAFLTNLERCLWKS